MRPDTDRIEEQAATWILSCDRGEGRAQDRAAFEAWLAADARHRAAYLRLDRAWRESAGLKAWKPHDGALDLEVLRQSSGVAANRVTRAPRWMFALAGAAALAATAVLWFVLDSTAATAYDTGTGGYQRIVLADGSIVQLNTDSRIAVRFSGRQREIRLLRGEAYFEIERESRRPFDVRAADTVVRALGTAFSVRLRAAQQVEVLVKEGRVAVSDRTLAAGETAIGGKAGLAVHRVDDAELARRLAWQSGQLVFHGEALAMVAAEFNRYNRRKIVIADRSLESLEVAGSFKATDLESFVAAMGRALEVRVEESAERVTLHAR